MLECSCSYDIKEILCRGNGEGLILITLNCVGLEKLYWNADLAKSRIIY